MKILQGKTFLLNILCVCSIAVYAGEETNSSASVIPDQTPGLGVSIAGLYLQPNANNLTYAVYTVPLPLPAPNWYQQTVKPAYGGAFALGLQYNFADKIDQVKLDWLHFNNSDSANFSATQTDTSVGPPYYFGPSEQFLLNTTANSTVKFNVDNVNLIFGHFIKLTNNIQVEPIMGVSAAYLQEDISNNYAGSDPVFGPYTHRVNTDSSLTGFGPRLGLDAIYFVNNHWGVNAGIASSILVGRLDSSTDFASWTGYVSDEAPTNTTLAHTTLSNQHQTVVIPEIDGKLGMFYTATLNSNLTLTVQLGYMFQDYINAIYQVLPSSLVPTAWESGTVAIVDQARNQSDLSMNGPYINLVFK